ncbi:hypothetical protein GH714_010175 [Hevea brasiliensis]|uniref:Exonuclease domain-containing protein n=1 Tax=Hevea brasiliensis TaxID=3981 RepID=A0A6A6KCD3_HEVBR|nr:hypothetical protein GH714_010175 [Hevea brasiliensis]
MEMQQQKKKNPKQQHLPLNPNWAQLQQKLKSHGSRPSRPSNNSNSETQKSILGKRKERPDKASDESQLNPLAPTNDDFSGNETDTSNLVTSIGKSKEKEIAGFFTKDFPTVQKKVAEMIKGRVLVGHALSNDLKALLLSHPKKDMRDTSEYQPFLSMERRRKALRHLAAEFLGAKIQNGEHCPIEDARAAMLLYQKNKKQWEKSIKDQMRLKQKQKKRKHKKKPKVAPGVNGAASAS